MGKKIDLTGQKFGKLTVLSEHPERKNKKIYWLCKCDCGVEKLIAGADLKSGRTISCGCNKIEKIKSNLLGKKFGRLTVIEETNERKNRQVIWRCKCDCGNIVLVRTNDLKQGLTTSCGCYKREIAKQVSKNDLSGRRFGLLTVIAETEERKNNSIVWKCLCDCGTYVTVTSGNLKSGHTISCGCVSSRNEMKIAKILQKLEYDYIPQQNFSDCKDVGLLRFDFGVYKNDKLLCLIEYDGEQHYVPVKFGNMTDEEAEEKLHNTQKRDEIKNKYCKDNNIPLLRIPYWDKKHIKSIISKYMNELEESVA